MTAVELTLVSPLTGRVVPLEALPDAVFAGRMIGDGVAIEPASNRLLAPCDGVVAHLHQAGHSITVKTSSGVEILMHIGIDTIQLNGRGFHPAVKTGTRVRAGDLLILFDPEVIAKEVRSLQTMVILTSPGTIAWRAQDDVVGGKSHLMTVRLAVSKPVERTFNGSVSSAVAAVGHTSGIHARPAALLEATARRFNADVTLEHKGRTANARSILALMALGANKDDRITITATGAQAEAAVAAVAIAIEKGATIEAVTPMRAVTEDRSRREAHSDEANLEPGAGISRIRGFGSAPGMASGRVVQLDDAMPEPPPHSGTVDAEYDRLAEALARVRDQVAAEIAKLHTSGASDHREILSTHLALLDDPEIVSPAERAVGAGESAGAAIRRAIDAQSRSLTALDNPLLVQRVADLRDIERRLLLSMNGTTAAMPTLFESSVLVANDVALSVFNSLPRERIAALCTAGGGPTSHVAIVARALGIPSVVALGPAVLSVPNGTEVLVDATAGQLELSPGPARLAAAREATLRRVRRQAEVSLTMRAAAVTRDGRPVEVAANVGSEEEARVAIHQGADGVGLLRTELLFLDKETEPTEAEQRSAYQRILDVLDGRAAIIRTFDFGGDKPIPFMRQESESNPALGLRGVRGALAHPSVLDTQLRALLGLKPLSAYKIMLPMVAEAAEFVVVQDRIKRVAVALGLLELPSIGIMVEVPSAALLAEPLASRADFLSIGTNDLVQYTLAVDRRNPALASKQDGLHPAVLQLIARTVEAGARHGKLVGVCGVLASDLDAVPVLIGLGVSELSVIPALVPEVKARVRNLDYGHCRREVPALLDLTSAADVRARVRELWPEEA